MGIGYHNESKGLTESFRRSGRHSVDPADSL
jgi:hypothetical protein